MQDFFKKTGKETLDFFNSQKNGLTKKQTEDYLKKYGPNMLTETKHKGPVLVFFEQFKDLLVLVLIAAAVISMLSGNIESTIVIFAVIILNAILGTVQHFKAEKSLNSLKMLSSPNAKVLRDGEKYEILSREVVPGDILLLDAGDLVVADARILENFSLQVNESALTGESESVNKFDQVMSSERIALGDQKNMVFSGSLVTYGRAVAVVTATGMQTEMGKIATLMNLTQEKKTPLQVSLDNFSKKLAILILAICAIVFGLSQYRQMPILDSLMFAVALAVAAIPEALGSIVTIVLALGTQKMAKQNAIMKDLRSVESLGAVSVICSDKTGTLTQNKMTVRSVYADGTLLAGEHLNHMNEVHKKLLQCAILANDAINHGDGEIGDPTEVALINLAREISMDVSHYRTLFPRHDELAFDSDRKLMSTLHEVEGQMILYTKGAIDVLLERATHLLDHTGVHPIGPEDIARITQVNEDLSRSGLRVLAFAYKPMEVKKDISLEHEQDYILIGLISMMDPPREESKKAVEDAKRAGIKTVMITGDHKITASAIAKEIGILDPQKDIAIEGIELETMSDEELNQQIEQIAVYARVSPEHKIRIVEAWQKKGSIVSMTGDGVNDAPALKQADIGVAMGITGTEVAKDAASMILTDDNFATIVKAVINGRNIYTNIKNSIRFLMSGNTAGILGVLYTSLLGLPIPFAPVHLLFINLLTDSLPAIAIGMEPATDDLLKQKPRNPKEPILTRGLLWRIGSEGSVIAVFVIIAYHMGLNDGGQPLASTMAFATLTMARLFHGFNCRSREPIFKLGFHSNPMSLIAFGVGLVLLNLVLLAPFLKTLFIVVPLDVAHFGWIYILAFLPTVIIQISKIIYTKRK